MFQTVRLSIISFHRTHSNGIFHTGLLSANPYDIYHCRPKHVEFYSKNKFEKLVHLVGFIIRIYHDAQSPERQNIGSLHQNNKILL